MTDARSSAVGLSAARIIVGVAVLVKAAIVGPILLELSAPGAIRLPMESWLPLLPAGSVPVVIAAWLLSGAAFLVGWRTSAASAVLCVTQIAVLLGDQQLYSNHLYLLTTVVALLGLADAGAALSLDARRRGASGRPADGPVMLLKAQVTIVYGFAALAKLNLPFLSGAVVGQVLGHASILPFPDALRTFTVMATLAWLAILLEGFLAIAFWFDRLRPAGVVTGVALHLSFVLFMMKPLDLVVFGMIMFALYLLHLQNVPRWLEGRIFPRSMPTPGAST